VQLAVRRALISPRVFVWSATFGLLAAAALVYLLDSSMQRFEGAFPARNLRDLLAPIAGAVSLPSGLRFWLADFAWSSTAALFAAEVSAGMRIPGAIRGVLALLAATSWELLQAFDVVTGVFDPVDLGVSAVAGALMWIVYRIFMAREMTRKITRGVLS
jgi:hypothetical protein